MSDDRLPSETPGDVERNIFAELSRGDADQDFERYLIELQNCMRCGQCRTNCPVFKGFGAETDVARGKIALLAHALSPEVKADRDMYAWLTMCVNCGRCRLECPSGTDTGYALLEGRLRLLRKVGMPAVKALMVRGVFGNEGMLNAGAAALGLVQPLLFRPSKTDPRHVRSLWRLPVLGQRVLLPRMRGQVKAGIVDPPGEVKGTVVVYPGCLIDVGYPELLSALITVYQALDYRVVVPRGLVCCGAPAAYAGDVATARRLAAANVAALLPHLRGTEAKLAFLCPSCAVAFNHDYPEYLFGQMSGGAGALAASGFAAADLELIAGRTVDATALAWELGIGEHFADDRGRSVTYHDPCHLRRLMNVIDEPRAILRQLSGDQFVEAANPDSCCGFGGTFALEHADASATMLERRSRELAATETDIVATACPGCMAWLANGLDRIGSHQRAVHIIELMAEAVAGV